MIAQRASVARRVIGSVEGIASRSRGLKGVRTGVSFVGVPGQGNSDIDGEVLEGPLRGNSGRVMVGIPFEGMFMAPKVVGFGEEGQGRELKSKVGSINGRLKGETSGGAMVLAEGKGSGGSMTMVPQKAGGKRSKLAPGIKGDGEQAVVLFEDSIGDGAWRDRRAASACKFKILIILMVRGDKRKVRITWHQRIRGKGRHRNRGNIKKDMGNQLGEGSRREADAHIGRVESGVLQEQGGGFAGNIGC